MSLYGGQVAAQALRAAGATVPPERLPHSLHGYFLRPGLVDRPVILQVDRDRDGGSFSARHVRAVQDGEVIFSMVASFHVPRGERAFDAVATRGGGDPETLTRARHRSSSRSARSHRPASPTGRSATRIPCGCARRRRFPTIPLVHACALTYVSDLGSGFGQVEVPGLPAGGPSIDHSLWFHDPIRADEWMLLELWPLKASSSRGVYSGSLRSEDGRLGALIAQEMLLRHLALDPETLRRVAEFLGVTPE